MAAQIPNNTNINDIIKSASKTIKNTTQIIKVLVGELDNLTSIIPDNFDEHAIKLDKLSKSMGAYADLIKKISEFKEIDTKHLKQCFGVIGATSEYITAFTSLLDREQAIIVTYGDIFDDVNKFNKLIQGTVDSINSINGIEKINFKTFIKIKIWLAEYEWVLNRILDINTMAQESYGEELNSEYLINNINNASEVINNINSIELTTLMMSYIKLITLKKVMLKLFDTLLSFTDNKQLVGKAYSKKLDNLKINLDQVNTITISINNIISNLKLLVLAKTYLNVVGKTLLLLPDIFDVLVRISDDIKKLDFDNTSIDKLIRFIKSLIKIELHVMLLGVLAMPFALAAGLSLIFVSIGMLAMQALMRIILITANPVIIRAVSISIRRLSMVILMIALAIASLAVTVSILLITHELITNNLRKILETILCIGVVLVAVVALGWLMTIASPFLAAVTIGMLAIGLTLFAIIGISLILKKIPEYGISIKEQESITAAVSGIMKTLNTIINDVFGAFDNKMGSGRNSSGDDGLVFTVSRWILGDIFVNLFKLIIMSTTLVFGIIAIGLVVLTAMTLNLISDNKYINNVVKNQDNIIGDTRTIMDTAKSIINIIFESFDSPIGDGGDGVLLGLAGVVLGDMVVNMIKLIISCVALTFTVIAVSLVKLTAMSLNLIGDISFDPGKVVTNTSVIMNTAKSVIAAINAPVEGIKQSEKSFGREMVEWVLPSGLLNMVDAIMAIGSLAPTILAVSAISLMAKSINNINDVKLDGDVRVKAENIVKMGTSLVSLINDQDETFGLIDNAKATTRISILKDLGEVITSFSQEINPQNHEKIINNTIKFVKSINDIKLENLQTAHNMFKEMKEFSESISGNFEGLADALNEKIAPLLEELKEMIGKIPESVDKSASTISGSMYNSAAMSSGFATSSNIETQVKAENPNMSKEEVNKIVDQRMNQQANSVNRGIEMKLEELIDVLQNYSNPIPVRMS